jgi:lysophospholipase L1-like esterase
MVTPQRGTGLLATPGTYRSPTLTLDAFGRATALRTRNAAYSLGGTAASGGYGSQTASLRIRTSFTKRITRMRVHTRNYVSLTDSTVAGTPTISGAYFGREMAPNSPGVVTQQAFPAGSGSLAAGGEWVSGWLTPDWDTRIAEGRVTVVVNVNNTNLAANNSSNCWYLTNGDPTLLNSEANWVKYGDCPLQTWIEYEYIDDGSPQVMFYGDSISDGYFGGPWNVSGSDMQFWGGHVDGYPEAWSRKRQGVAMVNAIPTSTAAQWSVSSSPKWTRFDTTASPLAPDAVVINLGLNDLGVNTANATIIANLTSVITNARARHPGVPIYFLGMIPISSSSSMSSRAADRVTINKAIANLSRGVIDGYFDPLLLLDPGSAASEFIRAKFLSVDGLHPTIQGHDVLADCITI